MIDFAKILETDQILLRPLRHEDFDGLKKITDDKDLWRYFTDDLSDKNVLREWIRLGNRK